MAMRQTRVENGMLEGVPAGNRSYTVFRSVPYAAAPVGDLRWRAPVAHDDWDGVYQAKEFRPIAAQAAEAHPFYSEEFYRCREDMSEDCLYLSVWTPAETPKEMLPVLVFIHGGAFRSGYHYEITIDGEALCGQGVVFVSVDYRLGALGYLAHPELSAETPYHGSGNWGLLDQIAALKWLRRNMAAFGGDPDRITIAGQSAGAFSVNNIVTSPLIEEADAVGAIMESGGGYGAEGLESIPMLYPKEAEQVGEEFLRAMGVSSIGEARALPWEKIVAAQERFCAAQGEEFLFSPVVDGYSQLMKTWEALDRNLQKNIPYMIGTNACENGANDYDTPQSPEEFAAACCRKYGDKAEDFLSVCGFESDPESAVRGGGLSDLLQPGVLAWLEKMADKPREKPIWFYYFSRALPGERPAGAYHSAELWYVFQTIHRCGRPLTGLDYDLAVSMNRCWGNFAKYGDPNGSAQGPWKPYTAASRAAMEFGERIGMVEYPGSARSRRLADMILKRHG